MYNNNTEVRVSKLKKLSSDLTGNGNIGLLNE